MEKVITFVKNEVVLVAAWVLAIISAFIVHPSADYIGYIDIRSLGILWALMCIMQAFKMNGVFDVIGRSLLARTGRVWQLAAVLIFLCFFSSMLITNDVALITFVPFAILTLKSCGKEKLMLPVIVFQTVAANLGSMMTPIGNPQNLYLYGISGMSFGSFIKLVLPYTAIAAVLLVICIFLLKGKRDSISDNAANSGDEPHSGHTVKSANAGITKKPVMLIFLALFILALLVVLRVVPFWVLVAAVLVISLIFERKAVAKADYFLLLTFVGFFIFTGNISRIPAVSTALASLVSGHEVGVGVVASQVISNVPAALLISDFADSLPKLILGVNFGGLGTLIASMASLISYKFFAAECPSQKKTYMVYFTVVNVVFLALLLGAYFVLG